MHAVAPAPPETVEPEQVANVGEALPKAGSGAVVLGEARHAKNSIAELRLS